MKNESRVNLEKDNEALLVAEVDLRGQVQTQDDKIRELEGTILALQAQMSQKHAHHQLEALPHQLANPSFAPPEESIGIEGYAGIYAQQSGPPMYSHDTFAFQSMGAIDSSTSSSHAGYAGGEQDVLGQGSDLFLPSASPHQGLPMVPHGEFPSGLDFGYSMPMPDDLM